MSEQYHDSLRPHVIPEIEQWPIYQLSEDRKQFVQELIAFTEKQFTERNDPKILTRILSKTIYLERTRVKEEPWKVDPPKEKQFWKKLQKQVGKLMRSEDAGQEIPRVALLRQIVSRYAEEIVGTFNKRTFIFARWFLTLFFTRLLVTARTKRLFQFKQRKIRLSDRMIVKGDIEHLRTLFEKGTVVIVPTHFSNLDSILVGYALDTFVGLPSFAYGAGLNLYNTGYTAYFMNRLGAYRVDRRKRNPIYLETLKAMSHLIIKRGVNSLFFPGGTRSRSGALETKLKLGLMSTVVEAQRAMFQEGRQEKVFVVPLVLSYHFVLEARYLIDQHLMRQGKEQYISVKDDGNSLLKMLTFAWHSFSHTSDIILSFGQPMDIMGNPVDENGQSFDQYGNLMNIQEYFMRDGELVTDYQRDSEYTKILAQKVVERYHKDNIVLASHLLAFVAFEWLVAQNAHLDLYGVLRLPTDEWPFDQEALLDGIHQLQLVLAKMEANGQIKLSDQVRSDPQEIIKTGIKHLGSYHAKKAIKFTKEGSIISDSFKLLYYYHNRLNNYQLEQEIIWKNERITYPNESL